MHLLGAEFDILIPAPPVNYWPWVLGIGGIASLAIIWWLVVRAVRKTPNLHNHADDWPDVHL